MTLLSLPLLTQNINILFVSGSVVLLVSFCLLQIFGDLEREHRQLSDVCVGVNVSVGLVELAAIVLLLRRVPVVL